MATAQGEYLEYKDRVNTELSKNKLRIDELKQQLASLDVSYSKDLSKSLFNESPVKTKTNYGQTFDKREGMETHEKFIRENFNYEFRNPNTNQVDFEEDRLGNYRYEEDENYYRPREVEQRMQSLGSPIAQIEIPEENDDPQMTALYKNLREKQDVYQRLKSKILNEIATLQGKQAEFENIEEHFKTRVVEAGQTEQLLKEEINEVKERLEILQVIKKREKEMSLRNKRKWLAAMKKLEAKIAELKAKQKELEAKIKQIMQSAEDLHSLEMKKFKEVIRETEKALAKIEAERKRDEERIDECQQELERLKNDHKDKLEEKKLKEQMLQETQDRIKMLDADIKKYEEENPLIVEKYKSKQTLEKELKLLNSKIAQLQQEVDNMDHRRINRQMEIDKAEAAIKTEKAKIVSLNNTIISSQEEDEEIINRIEIYFNRKRRESGMDTPHTIIQNALRRIETMKISDEIKAKEGDVLISLKKSLLDNVRRTRDVLTEEIKEKAVEVRHVGDVLKEQMRNPKTHNPDHEKLTQSLTVKFKQLANELRDLKIKKLKTELRLKHREKAIDGFVTSQLALKPQLESTIYFNMKLLPYDNEIADYIIEEQDRKPGCVTPEENLDRVVADYYELVRKREEKIQNCIAQRTNSHNRIKQYEETLFSQYQISNETFYQRKAELTDMKIEASRLQKQLDETRANIEIEILDMGNTNFAICYKKNLANKARKMEKVYGPRPVNQMKGKYKRDITDVTHMSEHRKIQNYQAALDLLEESKLEVEKLIEDLQKVLPNQIQKLEEEIKSAQEKLGKIKEQYTAVIDAERELAKHLRSAIHIKEEEIKDKTSKLYIETKFTQLEEELVLTKKELEEAEEEYKQKLNMSVVSESVNMSQSDIGGIYATQDDINAELLEEDLNLRKKYDGLKLAQDKLRTDIKPNLKTMEEERHDLEEEIKQLKANIEAMYEKYGEVRKAIQVTKDAITDKQIRAVESPNLGSFVDPAEKDEIDQEIALLRENKKSAALDASRDMRRSVQNVNLSSSRMSKRITFNKIKDKMDKHDADVRELGQKIQDKVSLSQLTSSLEVAIHGTNTSYKINLEDASPLEIEFFEREFCLLEGRTIYNPAKLSETSDNTKKLRIILLSPDLHHLIILNKSQFEKMKIYPASVLGTSESQNETAPQEPNTVRFIKLSLKI